MLRAGTGGDFALVSMADLKSFMNVSLTLRNGLGGHIVHTNCERPCNGRVDFPVFLNVSRIIISQLIP